MTGILRLKPDQWQLENSSGDIVESGNYPLKQDEEFISNAAGLLNNWQFVSRPYTIVDETKGGDDI